MQAMGMSDHVLVSGGVSFVALNYPLNVLSDASKHRNKGSINSSPASCSSVASSVQLSSLSDKTKNSSESQRNYSIQSPACSALSQGNTIGIIGGVSVISTLIFLEKVALWSSRNGEDSAPFIVCSDPMLRQEAYKPSIKTTATSCQSSSDSYNSRKCMLTGLDRLQVVENLRSKRAFLEEGGAQCIVMPCHISHAWYDEISQGCKLPFLHVAECVASELKEARFKPLEAGSGIKIGLIATDATLMAGFYQDVLRNQGFEVVLPDKATMEHIVNPAVKSLKHKDVEGARNLLRIAVQVLLVRAVNTVIVASDELQCLLPHDDPLVKKCINPMDALARSAVRWAMVKLENTKH